MTTGRVQHLEVLLADYQTTIGRLEREIEALRGDAITVNDSRTRPELVQELTSTRDALVKAEEGMCNEPMRSAREAPSHSMF